LRRARDDEGKKIPPHIGGGKREHYINAMERLSENAATMRRPRVLLMLFGRVRNGLSALRNILARARDGVAARESRRACNQQ
jgi:hypothetical protein